MKLAVVIGTYGEEAWRDLAMSRAYPSALAQGASVDVIHVHDETLALARNSGADSVWKPYGKGWYVFLDADDELAPGYLDAMEESVARHPGSTMHVPRVEYVMGRKRYTPRFPKEVPYDQGNWMVIGTAVPMHLFRRLGGFGEYPLYEDWALFAAMQKAGAVPVRVPDAVYVAHRTPNSRNHPTRAEKLAAHDRISRDLWPERYREAVA